MKQKQKLIQSLTESAEVEFKDSEAGQKVITRAVELIKKVKKENELPNNVWRQDTNS